ncbi:MAG TPA: aldo/keto reductase [Anaerolineae bacterium]|nr:aldo/keto reductase [Anaerolineae bacterium]
MRYKLFGRSGLRVSEFALGTMTFGLDWQWGADKATSQQIFDTYAQAGGNFIDTANRYTEGTSEKFVGEFIHSDRDHFVLATKYTLKMRDGDPNFAGNHRKNMTASVEASLKRLNTDYIDLFWLHAWDFTTPVDEVLRGLDDLVRQGKIHYIGISDTPAWVVSRANTMAELRGWSRFIGLQIRYSLIDRAAERDLLPMAKALDIAVTPWSILGAGVLTGKYNQGQENVEGRAAEWGLTTRDLTIATAVTAIAQEIGCSPSQVAIAWVLAQQSPHHAPIIPLIGARKLSQLTDNLGALNVTLTPDHLGRLNTVSQIDLGFPHQFLTDEPILDIVYGGTYHQLDNHRQ